MSATEPAAGPIPDHHEMVGRILAEYGRATDAERAAGLTWYRDANRMGRLIAASHGVTPRQAVGIVAALSPQMDWDSNLRAAIQLLRTGRAPQTGNATGKALAIAEGADPSDVLGGPKVRSFFDNMANPDRSTAVTVDRHAVAIATGRTDVPAHLLSKGPTYAKVADAYRAVADALNLQPHQVQAVTWTSYRNRKHSANRRGRHDLSGTYWGMAPESE